MTTPPSAGFSKNTFTSGTTNRKKQRNESDVDEMRDHWAIAMRTDMSILKNLVNPVKD